jgi:hypothetical protein
MKLGRCDLDPVAIALTQIEVGGTMRFSGTDLDSGAEMAVAIETSAQAKASDPSAIYEAHGLVLMLTIETISS